MWKRTEGSRRVLGLVWLCLALAAAGLVGGCSSADGGPQDESAASSDEETDGAADQEAKAAADDPAQEEDEDAEQAVPVEVATIARGPIESVLRFSTNLEAENEVSVYSQAARQVVSLLVEEGHDVRKGQVLLRLQDAEQKTQLARVESQLAKSRREYERQQSLFDQKLISEQLFNEATYDLEQLELSLADARRELSYTEVDAPITGTVTSRLVNVGDQVTVNQHLFDLVDFDSIVARVYVPEKELWRLRVGQAARIYSQASGDEARLGAIDRIAPTVDPRTGTVKVTVSLPRSAGLLPGMYVSVELITETHDSALLVPKKALVYDDDQVYVYRLVEAARPQAEAEVAEAEVAETSDAGGSAEGAEKDGETATKGTGLTVERLRLRPILEDRENIEPADTLEEGDRIVVAGQTGLKDGAMVRLVGAKSE